MIRSGWRKVKKEYCEVCGMMKAKEVHHINPRCNGGTNDENNLIDLCLLCHQYAPSNKEEFEEYSRTNGFIGSIIHNSCLFTLIELHDCGKFDITKEENGNHKGGLKMMKETLKISNSVFKRYKKDYKSNVY